MVHGKEKLMKLSEKKKNELAARCGYSEERRIDRIKEGIDATPYNSDEEHALSRKTIRALIDHIIFGKPIPEKVITAFITYDDTIEDIKEASSI